jgi:NAD(P)-dependent dehydrogenase (short-subunit alcohol dehydrogenase family)
MNKKSGVAIVTGGTRGIGFGIATALARAGYDLAINGVRAEGDAKDSLKALRSYGVDVIYCQGNIGNQADRKAIVEKSITYYKRINVLVNNAGVAPKVRNELLSMTEEAFDYMIDITLKGSFFLTQEVARRMVDERTKDKSYNSCIINITSISAEVASTNRGEYCMAKAGLGMMTKLFAVALAEHNIPVYEIRPGIIETDMTSGVKQKYDTLIGNGLTLEKRWGTPDDIGKIVAAIVKGEIPYSTGQVFNADGGMGVRRL